MLPQSSPPSLSSSPSSLLSATSAAAAAGAGATTTIIKKEPVSYAFKYLNSPYAKRQYPRRLKLFFDHLGLAGSLWKNRDKPS